MRPLRLRVENFTCFREPIEINFAGLDLFAITGPTGAGKSSLLDAMVFALYGKVPRIGGQGLAELIALGRDRMTVVFDFLVGPDRYRIARAIRRRGSASQVQLDEISANGEMPICSGVRDTDDKIRQLVGLAYDAFTKAVVLPQGEFAKFLKSPPGDQRKILRDLLRLQIYERMRDLAARHKEHFRTIVGQLEERLTKDYAGATADALELQRRRGGELVSQIETLTADLTAAEERLKTLRRQRDQTRELEEKRTLLAELTKRESAIGQSELKLDAARRTVPLIPIVEAAARAVERRNRAETDATTARTDRDDQRAAIQRLKSALERAERETEKLPALRKQIDALNQVLGQIKTRDSLQNHLVQARARIRDLKAESEAAKKQEKSGTDQLNRRTALVAKANKDLEAVGYEPELDHGLDAVRNEATTLSLLRESVGANAQEAEAAARRVDTEQQKTAQARVAMEKANIQLQAAAQRLTQAQVARDAAHQQHAAAMLRRELRAGEACPVCDQLVHTSPSTTPAPHLDSVEAKVEKARNNETAARKEAEKERDALAKAEMIAKEAQRAAEKVVCELDKIRTKLEDAEHQLDTKIGTMVGHEHGHTLEARVLSGVARITELRRRHERAVTELNKAQKARDEVDRTIEKARNTANTAAAIINQAETEAKRIENEIERVNLDIARITEASDPKVEREKLIGIYADLEDALSKAQKEFSAAEIRLSAAESRADETDKGARQAVQDAESAQKAVHEGARAAGFHDEAALTAAALPSAEFARLEGEVRDWTRDRDATLRREKELVGELGDEQVSEETLHKQESLFSNRRKAHADAIAEHARCSQRIQQLDQQVRRATELADELNQHRRVYTLYAQLADDLRSERFQAFLLDEVFSDLVLGASDRLWDLTEAYTLHWRDSTFFIVDHDNARQVRSADTLSGGETFLASLALALELSEQVQRASGAVSLDSLFIDEGFGTLDTETLDDAAQAIERLPRRGRTVGLITHLEELSARMPARVRVAKRPEGSRVEIEVG
jgi:DNA repair protein SbcC/Rad50